MNKKYKTYIIATDGAGKISGGTKFAASTVTVFTPNEIVFETKVTILNTSNILAEIYAFYIGVMYAHHLEENNPNTKFIFVTDSDFVKKALTKWIVFWRIDAKRQIDGIARARNKRDKVTYYRLMDHIATIYEALHRRKICLIKSHIKKEEQITEAEKELKYPRPIVVLFIALNHIADTMASYMMRSAIQTNQFDLVIENGLNEKELFNTLVSHYINYDFKGMLQA